MGLFSGSVGGGFFGSGGKSNSGNTHTISKNMHSADLIEDNSGFINSVRINEGQGAVVTMTDYGALESAASVIDRGITTIADTVSNSMSAVIDSVLGVSAENREISEYAIMAATETNYTVENIASEAQTNNAYLSEIAMDNNTGLASQFGNDLSIIADNAMTNNAILVDKTIDVAQTLTENQQLALDNMGAQMAAQNAQHADSLDFLAGQSIQANSQLTSQYMQSVEWLSTQTTDALQNFGIWTEGALDSALEVAGNVALDDSVEGLQNIFRYLSIAAGVIGVAYVVTKGFK